DAGRLARAVIALLPSWARARTPVAERSHARAQPVDRDPVRPWHDPSDLTYVDFVRSAMYQFDISARHLVGHAQRPGDDARTIGRPRAGHPGPAARRTPARPRAAQAAQRHAGDHARAVVRIAVPRAEVADGGRAHPGGRQRGPAARPR